MMINRLINPVFFDFEVPIGTLFEKAKSHDGKIIAENRMGEMVTSQHFRFYPLFL